MRGALPPSDPLSKTPLQVWATPQIREQHDNFPGIEGHRGSSAFSPYDLLPLIPAEGGISFFSLVGRVWELCDPQLTHEDVRQAVYALVRLEDLQVLPGYDGDLRIMHSDRSLCALQYCASKKKGGVREYQLRQITYPGKGEKRRDTCGTIKKDENGREMWRACSGCGEAGPVPYNCNSWECPECYTYRQGEWVKRTARRVFAYYECVKEHNAKVAREDRLPEYPPRHAGLNPPMTYGGNVSRPPRVNRNSAIGWLDALLYSDDESPISWDLRRELCEDLLDGLNLLDDGLCLSVEEMIEEAAGVARPSYNGVLMPDDLQRAFREILIRETYKALRKSGLVGAAVIVHDERLTDDSREFAQCLADKLNRDLEAAFYEKAALRHEKNPGRYPEPSDLTYEGRRYNRYTAAFTLDDYSDLLRFFPHIHIVCYGKFIDAREFQKVTGWNYENYSGNSKKDRALRSRGAVEKTLRYLSSHMPILKGVQSVRYWGCLSYHRLKCVKGEKARLELPCRHCGKVMKEAVNNGTAEAPDLEIDQGAPVTVAYVPRVYFLAGGPDPPGKGLGDLAHLVDALADVPDRPRSRIQMMREEFDKLRGAV